MTLEEAIKHTEDKLLDPIDYQQLADWLKELLVFRNKEEQSPGRHGYPIYDLK